MEIIFLCLLNSWIPTLNELKSWHFITLEQYAIPWEVRKIKQVVMSEQQKWFKEYYIKKGVQNCVTQNIVVTLRKNKTLCTSSILESQLMSNIPISSCQLIP